MGVASQVLSTFSRKPIFGYKAMVYAMLAIGFFGFMVWGHHMFMSGMSPYSAFAFSLLTMCIGVPSAIKTFNWLGTMWKGHIRFQTPMLYAIGFVSLFVSGGLSGPFLAQPVLDIQLHDTYFVVGHFHLIMGVAAIFGMFAATYYWFPKMFGRMMNETWGRVHFFITLAGDLRHLHADALSGHRRRDAALLAIYGSGVPAEADADSPVHDVRGDHHHRGAVYFCDQSFLEHVQGAEGERQSVGGDDSGVDDDNASAARQFWREDSGGESRAV
jgi:heme/copper-type cytochrome/quinol oxidase subunit 1